MTSETEEVVHTWLRDDIGLLGVGVPVQEIRTILTALAALKADVVEVSRALDDHNSLLRSAFQAAQRDATHDVRGTTNYRLLADRAHDVLTKHHATANAARALLAALLRAETEKVT